MQWTDVYEAFYADRDARKPWPWQIKVGDLIAQGRCPSSIEVPTGSGKTSIIALWLAVAGCQLIEGRQGLTVPRRLVYVVNRRTIVDQATDEAKQLEARLDIAQRSREDPLHEVAVALVSLTTVPSRASRPLVVSALRGGRQREEAWADDPGACSILIGTTDLVGSRLLFAGYGDSRYHRPYYAGLIGVDALIVHDEAHLTPEFGVTLRKVVELQSRRSQEHQLPPSWLMEVSATPIQAVSMGQLAPVTEPAVRLGPADEASESLGPRLRGAKTLRLKPVGSGQGDRVAAYVAEALAFEGDKVPVILYVSSAKDAQAVYSQLQSKLGPGSADRIRLLIGNLRGYERDQLVRDAVFRRYLQGAHVGAASCYLVSTSAGEVGIDLDAARVVMDLTPPANVWQAYGRTFDPGKRLVQRLGRVNRSGQWKDCQVVVLCDDEAPASETAVDKTQKDWRVPVRARLLEAVRTLPSVGGKDEVDGSVLTIMRSKLYAEAFTAATPTALALSAWDLDAWAATSLPVARAGARPVAPFLHGPETSGMPMVFLAWRREWPLLAKEVNHAGDDLVATWFTDEFPLARQELVGVGALQAGAYLKQLWQYMSAGDRGLDPAGSPSLEAAVLMADGSTRQATVEVLADELGNEPGKYDGSRIVLDPTVGGLDAGGSLVAEVRTAVPIVPDEDREALLLTYEDQEGGWQLESVSRPDRELTWLPPEVQSRDDAMSGVEQRLGCSLGEPLTLITDTEGEPTQILICAKNGSIAGITYRTKRQLLSDHRSRARAAAARLVHLVGLPTELGGVVVWSAEHHDDGKEEPRWQAAVGGDAERPLAKSPVMKSRLLGGYRHEFGSVRRYPLKSPLALSLVAAHHKSGRPGFRMGAAGSYSPHAEELGAQMAIAFVASQEQFGWWGRAWFDALVRAADHAASAES